MQLTIEQIEAAKRGEVVRLTADDVEIVILRADLYDQTKNALYNNSAWTEEELRSLAARTFEDADHAGPIE